MLNFVLVSSFTAYIIVIFRVRQWRSKALRGHSSTVTWGPPFPSPTLSPPSPSPPPYPHLLQPSPSPLPRNVPQIQLWGLGSAVSSPSGVWGGAPAEIEFGAFYALCSLLLVFFFEVAPLFSCLNCFCDPTTRGPRSSGNIEHWTAWTPTPLNIAPKQLPLQAFLSVCLLRKK